MRAGALTFFASAAALLLLNGAVGPGSFAARAQETGLRAELLLTRPDGTPQDMWQPGDFARLSFVFSDAASGAPARGLKPLGFVRRLDPGAASCGEAARAARATGRTSRDDLALTGHWIVLVGEDHRLAVLDPARPFGRGHLLAISPLDEAPGALVVRRTGEGVLATRPERGDVVEIRLPDGAMRVLASSLGRPRSLIEGAASTLFVTDDRTGRVLRLDKGRQSSVLTEFGSGPVALASAGPDRVIASGPDGAGVLLGNDSGAVVARFPPGALAGAFATTDNAVVSTSSTADGLSLRYFDDIDRPVFVPLPRPARGVAVAPDGRFALAWSAGGALDVVDLALGRRVHGFEGDDEVEEVAFAASAAFVTWQTRPVVTVIDLAIFRGSRGGTQDSALNGLATRDVRLAANAKQPARPGERRLVPVGTSVLAAPPNSNVLFDVAAGGGLSTAPMRVLRLGTAPPVQLAVVERSLKEAAPGRFEAVVRLPESGGTWEAVATTGPGGTTVCRAIALGDSSRSERRVLQVATPEAGVHAGEPVRLVVRLSSSAGVASPSARSRTLSAAALEGGWRRSFPLERVADGSFETDAMFPRAGRYPLVLPDDPSVAPFMLEVSP